MSDFSIFDELSEYIILKINSCHEVIHDMGWIESKIHTDYDIWYVKSGKLCIQTLNSTYTANTGDVIFFYPGNLYTAYANEVNCHIIYTHFDFGIGNSFRILDNFNLAGIIPAALIQEQSQVFKNNYERMHERSVTSVFLLKGYFFTFLAEIIQIHRNHNIIQRFPSDPQKESKAGKLTAMQPVLEYINNNLNSSLRVSDFACLANMSEKYFAAYFKKALGISPSQYAFQLKMNRARDYIYSKKYSIKQIASLLGYPDQYAFSKAFKKYYNVPPSKFN